MHMVAAWGLVIVFAMDAKHHNHAMETPAVFAALVRMVGGH